MYVTMQLQPEPFRMIAEGTKTIELRLYDEKRRMIRVGDMIRFTNTADRTESLAAQVTALHVFPSFEALYAALPLLQCGYTPENVATASPADMNLYYDEARQAQYGVVGIEIRLL